MGQPLQRLGGSVTLGAFSHVDTQVFITLWDVLFGEDSSLLLHSPIIGDLRFLTVGNLP